MNIDKQRLAAVRTLESLGYTWEGGSHWKPPLGKPSVGLGERDLDLLRGTTCRYFTTSYECTIPLIDEIRT